jgi:hypothetical protein
MDTSLTKAELHKLNNEAMRIMTVYLEHRNSSDEVLKRKVHIELDRFLMSNRDVAIELMIECMQGRLNERLPWYKKLIGGSSNGSNTNAKASSKGTLRSGDTYSQ